MCSLTVASVIPPPGDSSGSPLATPTCSTCCPCVCHHGPDTRYDAHAPDHRSLQTKHAPESKARYDHCSLDHRSPAAKSPEYKALHLCTLEAHSPDYCSPESTSIHESMPRHGHSPQPMPKDAPVPNHHSPESKARYDHHLPDDHLLDDPSLEWKLICDAHKLPPVPSECQEAPYLEYWYIAQPKMPENQRSQQRSPPSIPLPSLPRMELPLPSVPCIEMSITGQSHIQFPADAISPSQIFLVMLPSVKFLLLRVRENVSYALFNGHYCILMSCCVCRGKQRA